MKLSRLVRFAGSALLVQLFPSPAVQAEQLLSEEDLQFESEQSSALNSSNSQLAPLFRELFPRLTNRQDEQVKSDSFSKGKQSFAKKSLARNTRKNNKLPLNWVPEPVAKRAPFLKSPDWEEIPASNDFEQADLQWEVIPQSDVLLEAEQIQKEAALNLPMPESFDQAQEMLNSLMPRHEDYLPPLRLGEGVPTANQLFEQDMRISAFQLSPFRGGDPGGTGNQNYGMRFDIGVKDWLQVSAFASQADDPLYAPIKGLNSQPSNFWESYGGAAQVRIASDGNGLYPGSPGKFWNLALAGSLEVWNVGSGGCDSFNCKGQDTASPNIFNNSGQRVYSRNVIGSVALPFSWNPSSRWQFSISPGVSFLPETQGGAPGQGGEGTFYGNNTWLSSGALWRPIPELELFSSAIFPFGPGTNSFDDHLTFSKVPILTGGLIWNLNPRIALEGTLTNGWGATPATALLALPSANQVGYSALFRYTSGAIDTPQLPLTPRQFSLAAGGLTVNTALIPPDGFAHLWGNADSEGNLFGSVSYSLSNIFQLDLYKAGYFRNLMPVGGEPSSSLASTYASDRGFNWRVGGKAVALSPMRGAPLWTSGKISFGRNNDPASYQGYTFFESINTWEATSWLALNINPKFAWSGVSNPWGIGFSGNFQLGASFQVIPEVNVVASHLKATNATFALRWIADPETTFLDLYMSNAAGLVDMGQLMGSKDIRFGTRVTTIF